MFLHSFAPSQNYAFTKLNDVFLLRTMCATPALFPNKPFNFFSAYFNGNMRPDITPKMFIAAMPVTYDTRRIIITRERIAGILAYLS